MVGNYMHKSGARRGILPVGVSHKWRVFYVFCGKNTKIEAKKNNSRTYNA